MPKPILSDSLFNADDVATAILSEANLQVANSDLGVTDITSEFIMQTGFTSTSMKAYTFNGFIFFNAKVNHNGGAPSNGEKFIQINNSNHYPNSTYLTSSIAFQGDYSDRIEIRNDGGFYVIQPVDQGSTTYIMNLNLWFNFS